MALKGMENGVFQLVESPVGKRFVYLKRSNSNIFAAQGEIDVINKLLVYGTQRMKIQDYIDETGEDDVYISMLKRGIKDFAYRVYDRELVVLESDWQNGQHETLSEIYVTMNKWERTLTNVLDLIKRVKTKTKSGAAIMDHLFDIFDVSSHDQILHKSISHILAAVEHILICHIGKWVISGAISPGFFIEEIENSNSNEAEKICFVGNSLRILKFQSEINPEELRNYCNQAVTIFNGLRLKQGAKNENDQETSVPRLAWKQFGAVLNQMENLISDLIWDVFFTRGNLVPELGLLRDILLLNRADLFSNFYDLVQEHSVHEPKLRTTDLTFYWQQSLDRAEMDGDSTVCQKFAVSLKSKADDQNQGKLPDPYFNSESSIWSKISLNYTDETFRIFVSNLSRHQYESIYRLIARVRILKNQLIGNGKLEKTTCRFQMLLFVSQIEQYFFTEIEIEWCQLNKALQTKRFRAVQKAHQNYIFSITKKLFFFTPVLMQSFQQLLLLCEEYKDVSDGTDSSKSLMEYEAARTKFVNCIQELKSAKSEPFYSSLLLTLGVLDRQITE